MQVGLGTIKQNKKIRITVLLMRTKELLAHGSYNNTQEPLIKSSKRDLIRGSLIK